MHQAIVEINKVPTVVETWGRWIEEPPQKNETIVICIPGNPGVTSYYREFLQTIHEQLQCPVWCIGHAGHQIINKTNIVVPLLDGNEELYSIQGQIDHKEEFFRKYVPADAKVFMVGHSVGSYVGLKLLNQPDIQSKILKSYFLFPTVEDMVDTPNGKFLTGIIACITFIIFFGSWVFTLFSNKVQAFLVGAYFKIAGVPMSNVPATLDLLDPDVLKKVFYMAYDVMGVIRNIDRNLIVSVMDKIKLYYGPTDNWAPASYYHKIVEQFPGINAELCVRKFDHAFVLNASEDVGRMVAGWIETDRYICLQAIIGAS